MSAREGHGAEISSIKILLLGVGISSVVLGAIVLSAFLSAPPEPEVFAERYIQNHYDAIAESVVETVLGKSSARTREMKEIGNALKEQAGPYSCGGELQPFDDPTYDRDDWRCLMSLGVEEPTGVAIRATVDISMDWESRDWLGRDRAAALSAEIVPDRTETRIPRIGLPGNLHRISGGTLRERTTTPIMGAATAQRPAGSGSGGWRASGPRAPRGFWECRMTF